VTTAPAESVEVIETVEREIDRFVASADPLPATKAIEKESEEDYLASLDDTIAPLTDLVSLPLDSSNQVQCPFHDDPNPSCSIYPDHYYCHACGARGSRLDWLLEAEHMTRAEAIAALQDWVPGVTGVSEREPSAAEKLAFALSIWNAAQPLRGTIGEQGYLADTRGIDVGKLPDTIHEALRIPSALSVRLRRETSLSHCLDGRSSDRFTGRDSPHRAPAGERQDHETAVPPANRRKIPPPREFSLK
jgi:hypothetical protein